MSGSQALLLIGYNALDLYTLYNVLNLSYPSGRRELRLLGDEDAVEH